MKGKIIDYNFFEAFVALEDDTIIKLPLNQVSSYLNIGDTIDIDSNNISYAPNNRPKIIQDKLVDFF
ncbi:hypothetical protein H9660_06880 [Clostridium sp. Sa3CUN1]|uniref:Uncharacterized protein n=1 Tax=Clostridium gallinarum TaxID=2762246 RepID=A0ABR8Q375_9CLOT|nr:hypothetical protein [Clostridium gallinarum]MBD7914867.1 hypothetical protein [Clostridium gallinarum]